MRGGERMRGYETEKDTGWFFQANKSTEAIFEGDALIIWTVANQTSNWTDKQRIKRDKGGGGGRGSLWT